MATLNQASNQTHMRRLGGRRATAIAVAVTALFALLLAGCSRGAYPLDIFPEMHYQQSYKVQEPPSLSAPSDSVPTTGRDLDYTLQQARLLKNPLAMPGQAGQDMAKKLYGVNCAVCHGPGGKGAGPMRQRLRDAGYGGVPADLTATGPTNAKPDGEVYLAITKGFAGAYGLPADRFVMPPFARLLTEEERWLLVHFIRSLQ